MDKPSRFYPGHASHHMLNPNYDFSEINPNDSDASSSLAYDKNQSHDVGYRDYSKLECKQEVDPVDFLNGSGANEASISGFAEPYRYAGNQISPSFNDTNSPTMIAPGLGHHKSNVHPHRMGQYHISSTKNQLPSWYHPPSAYHYAQQPNFLQHQYPYHQGSYATAQPAAEEPMEQNMRNMIHLTSR